MYWKLLRVCIFKYGTDYRKHRRQKVSVSHTQKEDASFIHTHITIEPKRKMTWYRQREESRSISLSFFFSTSNRKNENIFNVSNFVSVERSSGWLRQKFNRNGHAPAASGKWHLFNNMIWSVWFCARVSVRFFSVKLLLLSLLCQSNGHVIKLLCWCSDRKSDKRNEWQHQFLSKKNMCFHPL